MKKRYFVYCLLLMPLLGKGQGFELFFGDNTLNISNKALKTIQILNEDAYLAVDSRSEGIGGQINIMITKVDNSGNILWEKQYPATPPQVYIYEMKYALLPNGFLLVYVKGGGSGEEIVFKEFDFEGELVNESSYGLPNATATSRMTLMPDNSAVFIATDFANNDNSVLSKIAQDGSLVWTKTYSETVFFAYDNKTLESTPDGKIISLGLKHGTDDTNEATKFDENGNILWQTEVPIDFSQQGSIIPYPAGDAYFIYVQDTGPPTYSTHLAKIGIDGQLLWSQDFTSHVKYIEPKGVIAGEGNTFYLTGSVYDGNNFNKLSLMQIGEDGNVIWEKWYNDFNPSNTSQLLRTSDGGFIINFEASAPGFAPSPHILKTDANGEFVWSWHSLHEGYFNHSDAILTTDGGYLALGSSESTSNGGYKNYMVKIDANGIVYTNFINGQLWYDENESCSYDNGEPSLADWKIKSIGNQTTYTTTFPDGSFWLPTNGDSVELSIIPPNPYWASCSDPVIAVFDNNLDSINVELFAQSQIDCPLLEVDASTFLLRRCLNNYYYFYCKNTGTIPAENVQLTVTLDSFFNYQNASIPLAFQNGNTLTFNIGNLDINESISFFVYFDISCDADIGQIHCVEFSATAANECNQSIPESALSSTTECQPNISSFDPNDKRAFSEGKFVERFIPADSIIEYQICFQNTGTDTAFNIVVTDTLSSLLDIESIIAGASSHPYHMELERNNILKFVFNDIMLPDSNVNEPASHGFVKFRIRHKPGLVPGDVIPNKAAIYFDFNDAVITNNLELEIESPISSVKPSTPLFDLLKVYPQPASDMVYFELKNNGNPQSYRLEVFNLLGQRIHEQTIKEGVNTVPHLPVGQHFYRLWQDGAVVETGKVMVLN
ncbi:MAG: hypothetical protein GC192_17830 [Bacteroidetes bacterium]|nr:hypothetical protein [Bacteroidota bacterium]